MRNLLPLVAVLGLTACGSTASNTALTNAGITLATVAAQNNTQAAAIVAQGALICGSASSVTGQLATAGLVAVANAAGAPVTVTNAAASDVAQACAALGKVAGPLPASVPAVTVPVVPVPATVLAPVS